MSYCATFTKTSRFILDKLSFATLWSLLLVSKGERQVEIPSVSSLPGVFQFKGLYALGILDDSYSIILVSRLTARVMGRNLGALSIDDPDEALVSGCVEKTIGRPSSACPSKHQI